MSPTNIANWSTNSYNIPVKGSSFCVKPGSMYTNKDANFNSDMSSWVVKHFPNFYKQNLQ